jgi:toxin ParE1/3/4
VKIVYAPRALRDIDAILAYIKKRSPSGAQTVALALERAIELSATVPFAGARTAKKNLYRVPISRHRLTIFYRVAASQDQIEVVRVLRAGRVKNLQRMPRDET